MSNPDDPNHPTRREALHALGAVAIGALTPACGGGSASTADAESTPGEDAGAADGRAGDAETIADAGTADAAMDAGGGVDAAHDTSADAAVDAAGDASAPDASAPDAAPQLCELTPEQVEGPYFVDTGLDRVDVREDREGTPLRVRLTIVAAGSCAPIEGAAVELWHADAGGSYSGFDVSDGNLADHEGRTFLRGFQRTDAAGAVEFETVYPGWYPGRAPHVHLSVLVGDDKLVSTQCYFDDAVSERVYATDPYRARGVHDTYNADDTVSFRGSEQGTVPLMFALSQRDEGYEARFTIGVVGA